MNAARSGLHVRIDFASEQLIGAGLAFIFIQIGDPPTGSCWSFCTIALSVGCDHEVAVGGRAVGALEWLVGVGIEDFVGIVPQHLRLNGITTSIHVDLLYPGVVIL